MNFLKLAKKNREVSPESWEILYATKISNKIHKKYSRDAELSILRQRDEKPEEFAAYYAFAEQCKKEVKDEMGISDSGVKQ
jgi:hypothetical protein